MISNLIDNAMKFAPQQNGKLDIVVSRSNSDSKGEFNGNVIVSVRDNGTGIDPEICRNYFPGLLQIIFWGTGLGYTSSKKYY